MSEYSDVWTLAVCFWKARVYRGTSVHVELYDHAFPVHPMKLNSYLNKNLLIVRLMFILDILLL